MKNILVITLLMLLFNAAYAQEIILKKRMLISRSVKVKKAIYKVEAFNNLGQSVLLISGNNIIVDFNGAVLKGSNLRSNPDEFFGVAIMIKGRNITIKNLTAKGYKVAIIANDVDDLKIENCDFSYNYSQHLNSTQEKEDISDWMSYHHNEKDEWLRYGAAIYLRGCNNFSINNCQVTGGQNALMLMECNSGMVYNNNFSFNSGIGIGLYQSSFNKFLYNKINFNVRGYSEGVYNRGQDSAGFLVYEQSSNNLFYKNSATHSGDGFFLWAGQTTMDTGKGGCNDNILFANDFSYAPTNGVEVTFSRNKIINNRIFDCDHGIWGGYSFDSKIADNQFRNNRIAIAIEHGQNNTIYHNLFFKDKEAIRLWARKVQPSDWGYAKYRDTRSHHYIIASNSFNDHQQILNINRTDSIKIIDNTYSNSKSILKIDSTVTAIDSMGTEDILYQLSMDDSIQVPSIKNPADPFKGNGKLAGRKNILMTEWGPYNFQYPIIWNTNPTDTSGAMNFSVLGPKGKWKIISVKGVEKVSKKADSFPGSFTAQKIKSGRTNIEIVANYFGPDFIDAFGNKVTGNKPYRFSFKKFFQPIDFTVSWYPFDSSRNPINTNYLEHIKTQRPFKIEQVNKLDFAWWGGIKSGGNQFTQFLTIAEGATDLLAGAYEVGITWDDAVRLYVDEKLVIDEWKPSKYKFDESPNKKVRLNLAAGNHTFRVEHVELGGFATLSLKVNKIK